MKELEIIVNAYEDIYNDNEVQKMFENFKKILEESVFRILVTNSKSKI